MNIPGYRIEHELGHGGMSTVYLAEQESLGRMVALKVMAPALAADRNFGERFLREARTVAQLTHPNILAVYDIGNAGHSYYLTMEHVPGGDLKQKLRQGALTPDRALEVLRQVAAALGYAHEKGFVHRDVKPENILFREDGTTVLADFGIAKAVGSGTKMTGTGMSIGTPHYMSPEQAQGRADVDGRSDLYSLGVVLYEMLTGQVPYDAENTVGIAMMHVQAEIPKLPSSLGMLQSLLDRLLAKDPNQRYASAADLCTAIEKLLAGENLPQAAKPKTAPKTQVMKSTAPDLNKGNGLKWVVGGALLVAILAGFLFVSGNNNPRVVLGGGGSSLLSVTPAPGQTAQGPSARPTVASLAKGGAILQVISDPAGAEVYLDDHNLGITPLTRSDLPAGKFTLKLTQKYYDDKHQDLQMENDQVHKLNLTLQRGKGDVTILSNPAGASVFLDDKQQGDKTPLTLRGITAGQHQLKIHLDRYYDQEQTVEVLPDQIAKLDFTLNGGELVAYQGKWYEPEEAARQARIAEEKRQAEAARQARIAEERRQAEAAKQAKFKSLLEEAEQVYLAALSGLDKGLIPRLEESLSQARQLYAQDTGLTSLMQKLEGLPAQIEQQQKKLIADNTCIDYEIKSDWRTCTKGSWFAKNSSIAETGWTGFNVYDDDMNRIKELTLKRSSGRDSERDVLCGLSPHKKYRVVAWFRVLDGNWTQWKERRSRSDSIYIIPKEGKTTYVKAYLKNDKIEIPDK